MKLYSPDFRERVVRDLLEKNIKSTQLYKIFKISRNTTYTWLKKYKDTGSLERSPDSGKKPKIDEKFKKIVNSDATQKELGQLYFGASQLAVCKAMKKIGYKYKKRMSAYQEREIKQNKNDFKQMRIKKEELVYVDESSVNNSSKDGYGYSKKG